MANSLITAQWVARKALVLLHAKSNFTGRCNRDYQSLLPGPINGVILGQQLSIRLPFQYMLRTGPQMNAQNSVQRFATLLVNQQLKENFLFGRDDEIYSALQFFFSRENTGRLIVEDRRIRNGLHFSIIITQINLTVRIGFQGEPDFISLGKGDMAKRK